MKNISMFVESGSFEEEEFRLCVKIIKLIQSVLNCL